MVPLKARGYLCRYVSIWEILVCGRFLYKLFARNAVSNSKFYCVRFRDCVSLCAMGVMFVRLGSIVLMYISCRYYFIVQLVA